MGCKIMLSLSLKKTQEPPKSINVRFFISSLYNYLMIMVIIINVKLYLSNAKIRYKNLLKLDDIS